MKPLMFALVLGAGMFGCRGGTSAPAAEQSAAELWAANCKRCHAMRAIDEYDRADWKVVMMHMRVRANLTGDEYRRILAFLQSGQ